MQMIATPRQTTGTLQPASVTTPTTDKPATAVATPTPASEQPTQAAPSPSEQKPVTGVSNQPLQAPNP